MSVFVRVGDTNDNAPQFQQDGEPTNEFFAAIAWDSIPFTHVIQLQVKYWNKFDGLVQNCSISSALAMEILQSCTEP